MEPKAKNFRFCGYSFDTKNSKITFDYRIEFSNRDSLEFTETVILPKVPKNINQESIQKILESLQLILGVSYFKLYCPPKITTSFPLSRDQANFWNVVYKNGLGEFLYRNKLNPKHLAKFPYSKIEVAPMRIKVRNRALLGIGGGKDSVVAAGLLENFDITSFLVETQRKDLISERIIEEIGKPSLKIQRILDPKIF